MTRQVKLKADISRRQRRKALVACIGLSRILHKAVDCFDGDLEGCAISVAIACASTSSILRDPELFARLDSTDPIPDSYHRPVSRRAIAASTGLPRETVRRKIAQLVEQGLLVEERAGVRTRSGVLELRRNLEFTGSVMQEIVRTAQELSRIDAMLDAPPVETSTSPRQKAR